MFVQRFPSKIYSLFFRRVEWLDFEKNPEKIGPENSILRKIKNHKENENWKYVSSNRPDICSN